METAELTIPYAQVTAQLRGAREQDRELLSQIRAAVDYLRAEHGYSLKGFADPRLTGLHKNSILRLKDPDWIPNPGTLEKLTVLIEEAEIKRGGGEGRVPTIPRGRPVKALPPPRMRAKKTASRRKFAAAPAAKATPPRKAKRKRPAGGRSAGSRGSPGKAK
jgi:hypothetical protein